VNERSNTVDFHFGFLAGETFKVSLIDINDELHRIQLRGAEREAPALTSSPTSTDLSVTTPVDESGYDAIRTRFLERVRLGNS
jgi:hypothetical protein